MSQVKRANSKKSQICKTNKTIIEAKDYYRQNKSNKTIQNLFSCFRFKNTNKIQPTVAVEQQEEIKEIHEVTRYKNQPLRVESYV